MTQSNSTFWDLSNKKIPTLFWQYALPAIIGTAVNTLYNIIDGVFIGHWVGKEALSALGIVLPVAIAAAGVGMLVGAGSATRISISLGEQDHERAEQIAGTSFILTTVLSGITITLLLYFLKPILMFVGASEATFPYARDFLQIFLPGSLFLSLCFNYNSMMRASGYPFKAMITMLISVFANIILAPIFIMWLGWGIKGAAIATIISMMISFCFVMHHFMNKDSHVKLRLSNLKFRTNIAMSIISLGLSPFFIQMASSCIVILINYQILNYASTAGIAADDAIAAFANANRLLMLIAMIVVGLTQGMQPIVGYNYGTRNFVRVKQTLIYTIKMATIATVTGFLLSFFIPELLVSAFSPDIEIITLSATALRYITLSFAVVGFQIVVASFFLSIGMAKKAIFISLSRQVLLLIPMLLILPKFIGLNGVWLANAASDLIASLIAAYVLYIQFKSFKSRHPTQETAIRHDNTK